MTRDHIVSLVQSFHFRQELHVPLNANMSTIPRHARSYFNINSNPGLSSETIDGQSVEDRLEFEDLHHSWNKSIITYLFPQEVNFNERPAWKKDITSVSSLVNSTFKKGLRLSYCWYLYRDSLRGCHKDAVVMAIKEQLDVSDQELWSRVANNTDSVDLAVVQFDVYSFSLKDENIPQEIQEALTQVLNDPPRYNELGPQIVHSACIFNIHLGLYEVAKCILENTRFALASIHPSLINFKLQILEEISSISGILDSIWKEAQSQKTDILKFREFLMSFRIFWKKVDNIIHAS